MKSRTAISIFVASVLALASTASFAQQGQQGGASADRTQQADRDRVYDQDRAYDRDRAQDRSRTDVPEQDRDRDRIQDPANLRDQDIYGHEFMTPAECDQYRKELSNENTEDARLAYQSQHEYKMQKRAKEQGKDLVPPGQGPIYGGELMSVQERNEYREQLRLANSDEKRLQLETQHKEQMQVRARELELEVEEAE